MSRFEQAIIDEAIKEAKAREAKIRKKKRAAGESAEARGPGAGFAEEPVDRPDENPLRDQIVKMKNEQGMTYKEISEALGVGQPRVNVLYREAYLPVDEHVDYDDPAAVADHVVWLREGQKLSWDVIASRMPWVPKGRIKHMFEDRTGHPAQASDIGRGGRRAAAYSQEDEDGTPQPLDPEHEPSPMNAPELQDIDLHGMNKSQIKEALEGAKVTTHDGQGILVEEVLRFGQKKGQGRVMLLLDGDGTEYTVPLANVEGVYR